ncbi:hypothetical protein RND71_024526 [Anisodus tanguticus]|uniref:DUF3700 domain-containing protein n=1 Tax=Anisodus tanguticus TaxID=243964 RepID=A0AAE1VCN2_9SOLA|nr:hypothetical protein RND71_024526 [Anisodus tanguticus]
MLAVFDKSVAKSPEALQSPNNDTAVSALKDGFLAHRFSSAHSGSVTINLALLDSWLTHLIAKTLFFPVCIYAGSWTWDVTVWDLIQASDFVKLFAVVDDIFCMFQGHIENVADLKQQYGLNKTANEVIIVIEAYRTLRDRGPYPPDQVVKDIHGKFAFILYDSSSKATFLASDVDANVPFFWGTDSEGHLVLSDDADIVKQGCGKSFAPFPKGCFFTSSGGLRSYEHPRKELKPVPRVDSSGEVCGANFKVDAESKKVDSGMPRVGSAANWSQHY